MRILNDIRKYNPEVKFLLENVVMSDKWRKVLTQAIGIRPIRINSELLSAQNRDRLYWTNINTEADGFFGDQYCKIPQPKDQGLLLKDILEKEVNDKYFLSDKMLNYFANRAANFNNGKVNIRELNQKASTVTSSSSSIDISDNFIRVGDRIRRLTPTEYERLQAVPDGYTSYVSDTQRYRMLGNGWTVDVIAYIFSFLNR